MFAPSKCVLEQDLLEECSLFLPMIMNRHLVVLLFSKGYPKESPYFVCKMVLIDILCIANLRKFWNISGTNQ